MSPHHLSRAQIVLQRPPANERGATREYLLHQAVADLFGDRAERGYVWREFPSTAACADILILSTSEPDAMAGGRMPVHRRLRTLVSKPFQPGLTMGQRLDFEIRVNATRVVTTAAADDIMSVGPASRKARKDIWDAVFAAGPSSDVSMVEVYAAWLRQQLAGAAAVADVAVTERRMVRTRRSMASAPIPFVATNLVGELVVEDPASLVGRMAAGIGRSRAFGCGLLCLARHGSRPRRSSVGTTEA